MKRLWFPAALLLLMFAAALGNALALERFTGSLAQTLLQAEERVGREDYGAILVALSPTPVSDGGGYSALIGA